jgi:outer membrane murein-binding lipoprotein Lpp
MPRSPFALLASSLLLAGSAYAQSPPPTPPATPGTSSTTIEALESRIRALEANAEAMRRQAEAATAALEATRAEIEALKAGATAAPSSTPETELAESSDADIDASATAAAGADAADGTADLAADTTDGAAPESANANAFNPAITLILNGSYTSHSLDPDAYQRSGFPLVGEGAPAARGFSLGESEISLAASIDDKFSGQLTLAIGSEDGDTELGVEEAYVDANALPGGLALRMGRFFSNIGYLNSHHAHTDKFFDRPLPYQAFVGNQYGDDGVQLRWVAPTELFLEVGGELFRGENPPSGGAANSGAGVRTLFAHAGGDIGSEQAWLAGLSMLDSRSEGSEDGFTGDSRLYIADATWKWAPGGNFKDGGLTLRGEYFLDDRDGEFVDPADATIVEAWQGKRRGAYLEGVYRINRNWETGYRYDRLWADDEGPFASDFDPDRHSLMLSWLNSEFSLLRLQYSHDRPNEQDSDNALTLQYQMNLGAHGAHKF